MGREDEAGRTIERRDVDEAVALMQAIGVHFAGSKADGVLRAVAEDGVRHPDFVTIYVLERDRRLAGVVAAFTRRAQYWRRFPAWHPAAAARMAAHRALRIVRRRLAPVHRSPPASPATNQSFDPEAQRMWADNAKDISKVMYVGVHPAFRGAGVGRALYRAYFRHLAAHGYRYCDAQVSTGNTAAIALHRSFPFQMFDAPGGYIARLDLSQPVP